MRGTKAKVNGKEKEDPPRASADIEAATLTPRAAAITTMASQFVNVCDSQ